MKKSEILIFCCLSFIIGIAFGLKFKIEIFTVYAVFLVAVVSSVVFWKNMNLRILFFGILFLFFGIMRASVETRHGHRYIAGGEVYGEKIKMQGIILDEPENSYDRQRFAFDVEKIYESVKPSPYPLSAQAGLLKGEGTSSIPFEGRVACADMVGVGLDFRVLVNANLYPKYFYGDRLEIECKLKIPEPFGNFRYDKYLELDNISALCYYPKIAIIERKKGNKFYAKVMVAKEKFNEIIFKNIDEPQASIMSAILLGNKYGISEELKEIFSRAGISHILAVSGMHIGILGVMLLLILNFIGISRKKAFWFSFALIVLYVVMIGAPSSAIRAAIMGIILMMALQFGRLAKFLNAVMLAGCVMLLAKPGILFYDIGFQFSFMAIFGIYFLYPSIKKFLSAVREFPLFPKGGKGGFFYGRNRKQEKEGVAREKKINEASLWLKGAIDILSLSLAAEIFILPLAVYYFSVFSFIAPIANLAVIWLVPFVMFLGMILIIAGWLVFYIPFLSFILKIIGAIISFLLGYFIVSAKFMTSILWSSFDIKNFPLWGVILCYVALGVFYLIFGVEKGKIE